MLKTRKMDKIKSVTIRTGKPHNPSMVRPKQHMLRGLKVMMTN